MGGCAEASPESPHELNVMGSTGFRMDEEITIQLGTIDGQLDLAAVDVREVRFLDSDQRELGIGWSLRKQPSSSLISITFGPVPGGGACNMAYFMSHIVYEYNERLHEIRVIYDCDPEKRRWHVVAVETKAVPHVVVDGRRVPAAELVEEYVGRRKP